MMKQVNIKLPARALALASGLMLATGALAQTGGVKGHVVDATGEPVMGATVMAGGKAVGITDMDGNFTADVNPGTEITITYLGMQPFKATATADMSVTLRDDQTALNEVVVIGYGVAKKSDLTGSVTAIKPDELNHGLQTNAQDMISGKIAGVNVIGNSGAPGAGAQIRIRGGSSLNASNDPLIVIDGLAMDNYGVQGLSNPLSMVNPNDIESFTVLKDASATAIYGSRASNGVIIITTKKGRSGQAPKVSYNGNVSIAMHKDLMDMMDGAQYTAFIKDLYGEDSDAYRSLGYHTISGEEIKPAYDKDGNLSGYKSEFAKTGDQLFADTDWQKQIYRTAISTDHNITVAGGLKNMPYRVSLGYTKQEGIVKTSDFERYTGSFNLSPTLLADHLKLNINGKGMIAKTRYNDGGVIGASRYMDPTKPVRFSNAVYDKYYGGYTQWYNSNSTYLDPTWGTSYNRNATSNPVALLNQKNDRATSKTFVGNIEADYKVHGFEDLHLHVNAGADVSTGKQKTDISRYSYANPYYGYSGWSTMDTYNLSLSAYAQYVKDFAEKHHLDVMAGYEYQHFHKKTDWDGSGMYPDTWTGPEKGKPYNAPATITKYETENYLVSFYGRLNYSLMDRYLFTFTLRDDGSSRFNKDNRWGLFPSVALAWKMKDEAFLRDVKWLSDAKLRLGWGKTGQQEGIGDYTYIPTYSPNQDHAYYGGSKGVTYRPEAYNGDLTWEKTTTWNAGLDFSFLRDRITMSFDWYYRKTTDLINSVYVSAGSNFRNKVTSNIGSLHNTGFEFATTVRPIQTRDFRWEVNYNLTYNKNKIDELVSGGSSDYIVETGGVSAGTGSTIQAHAVGHPSSAFYVYQQVYDQAGRPIENTFVDRNGNGYLDSGDRYFYYKPSPDVTMGLGSKFIYKGWDLSFSMRASLGNYVYNDNFAGSINIGSGSVYALGYLGNRPVDAVKLGFTKPQTEQFFSDYFVENASYLKMDNITLGYSFERLFHGAKYNGISGRVYFTAQNVFTVTDYSGMDPEITNGIDNSLYPRPFTMVLGLSLNF